MEAMIVFFMCLIFLLAVAICYVLARITASFSSAAWQSKVSLAGVLSVMFGTIIIQDSLSREMSRPLRPDIMLGLMLVLFASCAAVVLYVLYKSKWK